MATMSGANCDDGKTFQAKVIDKHCTR